MKTRTKFLLLAVMIVTAFFSLHFFKPDNKNQEIHLTADDHQFAFVHSLEGTNADGDIQQNKDGDLQLDAELKRLFDYYLSAIGEKSLPEIQSQIEKILDQKLQAQAARQAKELLKRYIAFKQALVDLEKNASSTLSTNDNLLSAVNNKWQSMRQLRSQFFSEKEIQAMFGFDDAYDLDALSRLAISQDKTLTDAERRNKLQTLDKNMPADLKAAKDAPYQVIRLEDQAKKMRNEGASEDDIYRMRAAATSPEAANRLAQVDRDINDWNGRVSQYLEQRKQLTSSPTNASDNDNDNDKQRALQQLRNKYFTSQEQRRLAAYE
ncbi:lipase chaperone [Undibacterium jejuense]|uniref:Lipase helper protein n=1 Tax=Undibacterium jejuense TaxID=1344949 RepID=A0A923HEV0_9BURK|nr:lipase secretion chaperone [Undibacterium jejuense]MBC3861093.1 lipase chaperone [Undibacterium jejuense]